MQYHIQNLFKKKNWSKNYILYIVIVVIIVIAL